MKNLTKALQNQFDLMCKTGKLFISEISGIEVWEAYLKAFSKNNDPIFRDPQKTTHDCNHCNNFIRRYGNIISIDKNLNIITIFDVVDKLGQETFEEYSDSLGSMHKLLISKPIKNIFFETFRELNSLPYESCKKSQAVFQLGIEKNVKRYTKEEAEAFGVVKPGEMITFNHFNLKIPSEFVLDTPLSIETIQSKYRSDKEVFQRGLEEIPLDTLNLVIDLINQGSLLNGKTHLKKIILFKKFKEDYDSLNNKNSLQKDSWCWIASYKLNIAKFKNELIGVLCSELAEGEDLNKACRNWNKRVDPANYMKAVAPITEAQKSAAKVFVEENNYVESFNRRLAVLDDIKANEIKHMNIDEEIKSISMFDNVNTTPSRHKRSEFDGIEEVSKENFMKNILPGCTSIEAYLENRLEKNFVSLTTSKDKDAKQIFKWDNPFSWTYEGNLAGKSLIEEAINKRGGNTTGVFNVRLHFPESSCDYDLCIQEPDKQARITYHTVRRTHKSSGRLDLDAQGVDGNFSAENRVENINYTDLSRMPRGIYSIEIDNYGGGSNNGFILEIKSPEGVSKYSCNAAVNGKRNKFIEVNFDGETFTEKVVSNKIKLINSEHKSKEIYGLETQKFHKVNLVCLSPNHWGDNNIGNKHYFFMLEKCKINKPIRSFHSENLLPKLSEHRKVLEVLGNVNMIEPTDKQLSGLGFNDTIKESLILKIKGSHKRVIKVKF